MAGGPRVGPDETRHGFERVSAAQGNRPPNRTLSRWSRLRASSPDGVDAILDLVSATDTIRRDAEILKSGGSLVSTLYAADEGWFAERQITAHNISSSTSPLSSRQGLDEVARMVADGMIAARIRSTVELDGVSQRLEKLHNGGLRGKAVIRR